MEIANFNSLWEIGFTVNVIFVCFEFIPVLNKKFNAIQDLGDDIIVKYIDEKDRRYVMTYGWQSIVFSGASLIFLLIFLSAFNSLMAICLLTISGFFPAFTMSSLLICIIIFMLFAPIILIPMIIVFKIPAYKIKCIEEAIEYLIKRNANTDKAIKYKVVLEYIKYRLVKPSLFSKKVKKFDSSIIDKIKEYD